MRNPASWVLKALSGLLIALVLATAYNPAPGFAQQAESPIRLRIGVASDGITAVTPDDLLTAGVDPATIDPRTFAMSSLGQPVAIYVTGEDDGSFDPGDRIYFFGERFRGPEMEQKYTDERVYWLDIGGAAGPRVEAIDALPQYDVTAPSDFATTLRAEESEGWWALETITGDTQDTWFWARLLPPLGASKGITVSLPYTVPHPAGDAPAVLRLEQNSRAHSPTVSPDHRTTISLNNHALLDATWDGLHVRQVLSVNVPPGLLVNGTNTVEVGAWNLPDVGGDDIFVNYWEVDYRRLFLAREGQLDFAAESAGVHEYETSGWATRDVWIWDVTDPLQPRRLLVNVQRNHSVHLPAIFRGATPGHGAALSAQATPADPNTSLSVRFRTVDQPGSRYWLQSGQAIGRPLSVQLRTPTGLRTPPTGADSVIITPGEFVQAAERLAAWHRDHGRRVVIADIQDVYDEFNQGIYHPKAVVAMLQWAATEWPSPAPAFLTLLGDGHWNFKGYALHRYPLQANFIPPYLAWVDPWQGEVPADPLYGDLDNDGVPEIAVGRLAVTTLAEAEAVVDKIVNYDEGARAAAWQQQSLFVADNTDSGGNYRAASDEIVAGYVPADQQVIRAYLPESPTTAEIEAVRATISDTLQSGVWMVQYSGHGAIDRWAAEGLWRNTDAFGLRNGSKLPVVMTFNCLDGYFAYPDASRSSVAEMMQRQAGGGSIAAISPTGLSMLSDQHALRRILMNVIFRDHVRELGAALTLARQRYVDTYGADHLIQTMTLFGEPALRLPGEAG